MKKVRKIDAFDAFAQRARLEIRKVNARAAMMRIA